MGWEIATEFPDRIICPLMGPIYRIWLLSSLVVGDGCCNVVASEGNVRTKVEMVGGELSREIYISVNFYRVCSLKEPGEIVCSCCVLGGRALILTG